MLDDAEYRSANESSRDTAPKRPRAPRSSLATARYGGALWSGPLPATTFRPLRQPDSLAPPSATRSRVGRRWRLLHCPGRRPEARVGTAMLRRGRSERERPPHRDDGSLQEKLGLLQAGPVRIARTDSPAVKRAGERARRMAEAARAAHNLDGLLDAHRACAGLRIVRQRRG